MACPKDVEEWNTYNIPMVDANIFDTDMRCLTALIGSEKCIGQ
jgi:hypothetical protein